MNRGGGNAFVAKEFLHALGVSEREGAEEQPRGVEGRNAGHGRFLSMGSLTRIQTRVGAIKFPHELGGNKLGVSPVYLVEDVIFSRIWRGQSIRAL